MKRIAVTGGAGQINYNLLFRIASGDLLGKDVPVALHILEVPPFIDVLKGVVMELNDCCFPLLQEIVIGTDPFEVFEDVNFALLVGAKPRSKGMERKDLILDNGKIFVEQGKALNAKAAKDVKVVVVGNPCNTNCLICMHNAPDISKDQFFAMTRLDENRAKAFLAQEAKVLTTDVKKMAIWGNHSKTQVPDFFHAEIQGKKAIEVLSEDWLKNTFVEKVQNRGGAIIEARGKSSAASAASAALDTVFSLVSTTPEDDWHSLCLYTKNNPYNIDNDLIFSFPCRTLEDGSIKIIEAVEWTPYLEEKIALSQKELLEEREMIAHLL